MPSICEETTASLRFTLVKISCLAKPASQELFITGIWVEAYGDGAATHVTCDFELLVVDN